MYLLNAFVFNPRLSRQFSSSLPKASLSRKAVQASPGKNSTPEKIIIETRMTVIKPNNNLRASIFNIKFPTEFYKR
jgi:hypothetical protein